MNKRYQCQMQLSGFGDDGQRRLEQASVVMVGLGGLGCAVAPYLAGAGVGELTLVDGDVVALHNLHRQCLYGESDVGTNKAAAATHALRSRNSEIELIAIERMMSASDAAEIIADADVVLDCSDRFAVSYLLSDACMQLGKPLISASAIGQEGYVGAYCAGAPSLRAVFPRLPARGQSCQAEGVFGPLVGMIGCAQAQMTLQCLLNGEDSPLGSLFSVDVRSWHARRMNFRGAKEPNYGFRFTDVSSIAANTPVLDLRSETEANEKAVDWAKRAELAEVCSNPGEYAQHGDLVIVCASGLRAWRAAEVLHQYRDDCRPVLVAAGTDNG